MLGAVGGSLDGTLSSQAQQPGPCDPPNSNPIVCENEPARQPASEWDISGAGDSTIQGFATDISVDQGQTVGFKIDTNAPTIGSTSTGWVITAGWARGRSPR